ncbi:MAG TPA: ABC transporter ATP-binding protein [Gammaproteobacteria bacterium]|nr:ABC transporter ATP-binding protein [Gammaproteobacteria bacterium]
MAPVLEVQNLHRSYPGVEAVRGVSFQVGEGRCFGLLGPNGAGKTTTVEIMEGILPPSAGLVRYRGQPIGTAFRAQAGIQFQSTALQDFLTVRETLELFARLYPSHVDLDELIAVCSLQSVVDRDVRRISGGQRQRVLLAIALVNDPAVLFLDEPTTGLDPQARRNFWDLVREIKARRKTIILTTHYMDEAYHLCDEIAIMDHGRIIAQGPPVQLLEEHFRDTVLVLPRADFTIDPQALPYQVLFSGDMVEISVADVDEAIRALATARVSFSRLRIRPRNLEDLFLELTGKELRA